MNKRIVRITALIAMFFVSVTLAAVFAFVKPSGAQAEASGATAWGTEIEDCLYRKGEWGEADTTDFAKDSGATANGFEKSYVKTLDAGKELSGQLSHASIKAEYTEVRFAIKTVNGRFRVDDFSASDSRVWLKAYDDWAYFVLTRADAGWEIKVYFGNELVHETVNADGKDFVCSILWHQAPKGMIVYPDDSSKEMTVYCTELRAAKEVPLSMVEGASLRIDDEEGGIRFRAKMNEKTASAVINGSAAMNFVIAPKTLFDTVTDGNYANLTKKIEIPVDGTKVYKDGDYYYANGVIANILEANRSLDFCATAYITANGTTTYAEADFSLTRGNLYDIVNQLVVIYGKEYAESILAATPYEWYGKGDYPIVIDTVEQYNALAAQVNGGRDFSAYTAKIASGVKSATDKTEITKPEFFPQVKETGYDTSAYTDKIMECAGTYNASNNNGFEATTEVASPSGFENVFKSVSCSGFDFGHSQSLDGYVKVCFALKSDGKYKHSKAGEIDGNGKWVYFELSRETSSSHDWKIRLIDVDNNVLFEVNRTDTNGFNTLCGVLWHGGDDFSMSGASYVYCTELRGSVEDVNYNVKYLNADGSTLKEESVRQGSQIALPTAPDLGETYYFIGWKDSDDNVWNDGDVVTGDLILTATYGQYVGEIVDECLYKNGEWGTETTDFVENNGEKAEGFSKSYVKTISAGTELTGLLSHTGIGRYSEVRFAIKTSNGNYRVDDFSKTGNDAKVFLRNYEDWTYFVLTKVTTGWNVKIYFGEELVHETLNTNEVNTVCQILWHSGNGMIVYPNDYSNEMTVYCTEIRGKLAENTYNNDSSRYTPTHWYEASDTEDYLVKNGETEYTVVIPSQSSEFSEYAKTELVNFFSEATGIELNVVQGGSQHTPSGKIISLGDTYSFRTSGLSGDTAYLGRDGARIVTKDKSVYIIGGSERGVLYGVYDFLKIYFGYEVYYKDSYTLDTGVAELKLKDFDVTDIPDLSLRARGGVLFNVTDDENDVMFAKRMRTLDDHNDYIFPIYKEFGNENSTEWSRLHNSSYYLPYETYYSAHPKFFSGNGNQLCYTAHGDSAEFEEMTKICAEKAEQSLRYYTPAAHPSMNVIHLGAEDERTSCNCSSCTAVAEAHNGSNAAAIMIFLNAMGEKVVSWMNEEANAQYKRNDLTFSFFVYQNTVTPPFTVNGDGSITVADDLKPSSGVKIRPYAAFSDLTYYKPISDSVNKDELEKVEAWSKFVENGWSWSYGCFFRDYFCFYDLYPFYADYYAELYECGYEYAFAQFHSEQRGADTGFYTLASYLNSKLMWDSSLNIDELTKNYFEAMYGAAEAKMYEFYGACRSWFNETATAQGWDYNSTSDYITSNANCFTYATVEGFFDKLDEAYAAIEGLKTADPAKYETLKSHIDLEWLFPAKVAITLYQGNYDSATLSAMKTKFKSLCEGFGMTKIGESESIDEFINSL